MSTDLMNDLEKTLKDVEIAQRHSYFQLKYFIIGKEPTHQARMWACLRELKARKDSLKAVNLQIEDSKDQLELLLLDLSEHTTKESENKQRHDIKTRQIKRNISASNDSIAQLEEKKMWILQETNFFLESYKNLEKVEALKHFDDIESQKQYWGQKLANKVQLKMLLQQPLDLETVEVVLSLPDQIECKKQMIQRLNNVQKQLSQMKEEYRKQLEENKKEGN